MVGLDDYEKNHNQDYFKWYWNPDYETQLFSLKTSAFIEWLKNTET